jgi:hypothetical protein
LTTRERLPDPTSLTPAGPAASACGQGGRRTARSCSATPDMKGDSNNGRPLRSLCPIWLRGAQRTSGGRIEPDFRLHHSIVETGRFVAGLPSRFHYWMQQSLNRIQLIGNTHLRDA